MHMADALLSPSVGAALWAVSGSIIAYSSQKIRREADDWKVPLMGVLGAFVFSAQMVNFTIPLTGSSGHLGGGLLLSILLGPYAAFLTIASVLVVQALFFADGGLLALGCNIFNLGFFPAFIAYPLIYRKIAGSQPTPATITIGAIVASISGLQLGAFSVVLETLASGITSLPFSTFALLMQPIHLPIGIVEGIVTAMVVSFVRNARPEILQGHHNAPSTGTFPVRTTVITFLALALVIGGLASRFASEKPDGLEWSIQKANGMQELETGKSGIHRALAALQETMALLPDYTFKKTGSTKPVHESPFDNSMLGTSIAGVVGGLLALVLSLAIGFIVRKRSAPQEN